MPIVDTRELPVRAPKPGGYGRLFSSKSMTFAFYAIEGGAALRRTFETDGKLVAHVRGAIFYEDARGERHHSTFCRVLDAGQRFVPPARPGYNCGD